MYSVMWSEHCSYKSSQGAPAAVRREGAADRRAAGRHRRERRRRRRRRTATRSPSRSSRTTTRRYVEPYQGAATGVGGIVRDILAMGARPVAVMDPLRFGPADAPDTAPGAARRRRRHRRLRQLPGPAQHRRRGRLRPDATPGNPLVNALCVGVMRHEDIQLAKAAGPGNKVVLFGATTGGDGIGGVSVLAARPSTTSGPAKRPERAGRRPVHGEAAHRVLPGDLRRRPGRRHPGPRRRRAVLRDHRAGRAPAPAACTSSSTGCRCATRRSRPRRS